MSLQKDGTQLYTLLQSSTVPPMTRTVTSVNWLLGRKILLLKIHLVISLVNNFSCCVNAHLHLGSLCNTCSMEVELDILIANFDLKICRRIVFHISEGKVVSPIENTCMYN